MPVEIEGLSLVKEVIIAEEDQDNKTGGHYRSYGIEFSVASGETGLYDFSFPYDIALLSASLHTHGLNSGDHLTFKVAPNTTVGTLVSAVSPGDTVIGVSQTVIDNTWTGSYITLNDGTNSEMQYITNVDDDNNQITLSASATNSFEVSSPTYLQATVCMAEHIYLVPDTRFILGESKIGGSHIPANTTIRVEYYNSGQIEVDVRPSFEFLY
jgi:hypothetical protein